MDILDSYIPETEHPYIEQNRTGTELLRQQLALVQRQNDLLQKTCDVYSLIVQGMEREIKTLRQKHHGDMWVEN
ncbi:hypothetical protein C4571_01970 [Candidatus Parcubacteria bacterium]|nr:MAG: hypothetical protein C4571_01970 [Candidatus Parcubacteria bacterium]